jgi:molybdopterin converting factor small subunit
LVTIHFYAGLRELAKTATMELDWQSGLSAASLRETISQRVPDITSLLEKSSLAVNDVIVGNEFVLPDGAEVALLPPVSGG